MLRNDHFSKTFSFGSSYFGNRTYDFTLRLMDKSNIQSSKLFIENRFSEIIQDSWQCIHQYSMLGVYVKGRSFFCSSTFCFFSHQVQQFAAPIKQYLPPVHHAPAPVFNYQPAPQVHHEPVHYAAPAVHYAPAPVHHHEPAPAASFDEKNGYTYNVPH